MSKNLVCLLVVFVIFTGMFIVTSRVIWVRASETIYIRSNGDVEGTDKIQRNGDNYMFTANINDSIVVERDNILLDGAHYTLRGARSGTGISLSGSSNVTIKNMEIKDFNYGISLSSNNTISENNITANNDEGILVFISNNNISGNNITANNSYGIKLISSNNNIISRNNITANGESGIWLSSSSNNNIISRNNITAHSSWHGIRLDSSSGNIISRNNISNNDYGIRLSSVSNNSISENNIAANKYYNGYGIHLYFCANNTISGNNITANDAYGIWLSSSSDNRFYHNNFVDNTQQVSCDSSSYPNVWDEGYPSGGNYWSDYETRYPEASEIDDSGIWDTPYVIDENNQDNYPVVPEFSSTTILVVFMALTMLAVALTRKKRTKRFC